MLSLFRGLIGGRSELVITFHACVLMLLLSQWLLFVSTFLYNCLTNLYYCCLRFFFSLWHFFAAAGSIAHKIYICALYTLYGLCVWRRLTTRFMRLGGWKGLVTSPHLKNIGLVSTVLPWLIWVVCRISTPIYFHAYDVFNEMHVRLWVASLFWFWFLWSHTCFACIDYRSSAVFSGYLTGSEGG
jgi:hypothetical protein